MHRRLACIETVKCHQTFTILFLTTFDLRRKWQKSLFFLFPHATITPCGNGIIFLIA